VAFWDSIAFLVFGTAVATPSAATIKATVIGLALILAARGAAGLEPDELAPRPADLLEHMH
jgi:hypothetical protein